ncbi:hypothetical protein RFF05_09510 [Bengtsoniella intestinalis]|uniref:hypothetical protein n=1 Tax=Bengtsoniella intestinalis TaxID=3073143 RepID=UPI00391F0AAC
MPSQSPAILPYPFDPYPTNAGFPYRLAADLCNEIICEQSAPPSVKGLFIYGDPSYGKTNLLLGIQAALKSNNISTIYIKDEDFFKQLFQSYHSHTNYLEEDLLTFQTAPVLLFDDFGKSLAYTRESNSNPSKNKWISNLEERLRLLHDLLAFRLKYSLTTFIASDCVQPDFGKFEAEFLSPSPNSNSSAKAICNILQCITYPCYLYTPHADLSLKHTGGSDFDQ